MKGLKKIYNLINRDTIFENEPKRFFVLLRWMYLLNMLYFVGFILLMSNSVASRYLWITVFGLVCLLPAFWTTYHLETKRNLIIFIVIQVVWILSFMYLYGWDCGVQHFIFIIMTMFYFTVYDAVRMKILGTIALFLLRFSLFLYCREFDPIVVLPNSMIVIYQIYNSMFLFLELGIIYGTFSSNVESVEKKLVQYNEKLQLQASTDPLTGIWNRRTMMRHMNEYREQNSNAPFVLAMGDIDFFKHINDTWGHDCGDAVLVWVTELFADMLKNEGTYSRWGGEEFMFHFPNVNGDYVCNLINKMNTRIEHSVFKWNDEELRITMTFGIEENDFRSSMNELIKNVDEKLYHGKATGRNRVIF